MTRTSRTFAAIALAAGLGFADPPAADAHDHHHDGARFHRHHHHHNDRKDGFVNWCYQHPRLYDPSTDTYVGADDFRHYCRDPVSY